MVLLVLWRLLEAALGHEDEDGKDQIRKRLGSLAKAVIYGAIAVSAIRVATGSGSQGAARTRRPPTLMDLPAGRWIVAGSRPRDHRLRRQPGPPGVDREVPRAPERRGQERRRRQGVHLVRQGRLHGQGHLDRDHRRPLLLRRLHPRTQQVRGLDVALHKVLEQPFGQFLLLAIAAGIACYGLFCFARARHLSR